MVYSVFASKPRPPFLIKLTLHPQSVTLNTSIPYTNSTLKIKQNNSAPQFQNPYSMKSHTFVSDTGSESPPETSTLSDCTSRSDEEVLLLASSRPKKRAGRRVFKETRHPVYRGVRSRNPNRWVCELREPNKKSRIWLGTYRTPEMAARAHDVAALALKGRTACLNFADSAWLPPPASTDAEDIRRAAAAAAEAFLPTQGDERQEGGVAAAEGVCRGESGEGREENVGVYVDEEEVFEMPRLLVHMAEGLLLSPPPLPCVGSSDDAWGDVASEAGMSLWNF
ncbi:dehydration-responsive element-binding protein 1D-like [Malania oleifera]|uniref:dehydration-responsive element-binding protein 1D-like n=1 Tax=Malania oleifera TaxID=397392 RepID=UPI0025ADC882|nr:dehydration-responsive element-binding protein 1D-like [Malania oleifera]